MKSDILKNRKPAAKSNYRSMEIKNNDSYYCDN